MNKDTRKEILEQIAEGRISADEGFNLLQKIDSADKDISRAIEINSHAPISLETFEDITTHIAPYVKPEFLQI